MVNCGNEVWSLIVYWLLKKSENIGKKTNQSRVLKIFVQQRQEQQIKMESNHYQKYLTSKTFSCTDVSLKVWVKVSVQKYRQYFLQKYRYRYRQYFSQVSLTSLYPIICQCAPHWRWITDLYASNFGLFSHAFCNLLHQNAESGKMPTGKMQTYSAFYIPQFNNNNNLWAHSTTRVALFWLFSVGKNLGCLWRRLGQHLSLPGHLSFNPVTQLHSAPSELLRWDLTGWWHLEFVSVNTSSLRNCYRGSKNNNKKHNHNVP